MQPSFDGASFATTEYALKTVMALLGRHAYLPVENLRYQRNFVSILERGVALMEGLGALAHPPTLGPCARMLARFTEVTDAAHDPERLRALREELLRSQRALRDTGLEPARMAGDFSYLKGLGAPARAADALFGHLCRLAPLLYNHDGEANSDLGALAAQIESLVPGAIGDLYHDYFPHHLAPLLIRCANTRGLGALHKLTRNVLNQFVPRVVTPAIQIYASGRQQVARRTLTLEEVPPVYSPLRGALAGDCSMVSVPYYGVLRTSHSFWVRKQEDFDTKPAGYVILTLVAHEGRNLPYVLTINGVALSTADCLAVMRLIAAHYDTDRLLLADLSHNPHYVNTTPVQEAFGAWPGAEVAVSLPPGWREVGLGTQAQFRDYYLEEAACHARLVVLPPPASEFDRRVLAAASPYVAPERLGQASALNRALTLHYYRRMDADEAHHAEAQALLELDDATRDAAVPLVRLHMEQRLSFEGFASLHRYLGFGLKELGRMPLDIRGPLLRPLYDADPAAFPEHAWVEIITATCREIDEHIARYARQDASWIDNYLDMKVSLPDIYLPNYWEEVRPLLFLANGRPSAYHSQRFVKSFHSVGTIDAFLDFLLEYPELIESIDTEYRRWSDFFIRARDQLGFIDKLTHILEGAYVRHLRDTNQTHTCYHLAKTLVEYGRIFGRPQDELRSEVIALHLAEPERLEEFDDHYHRFNTEAAAGA